MRRLCEDARFPWVDATVPQLCMWLHSRWRFGESWQMDGSTVLFTACLDGSLSSHSVSAGESTFVDLSLYKIPCRVVCDSGG